MFIRLGLFALFTGLFTACASAAEPATYLAPVVAELQKKWPANRSVMIVFHGHSVPAGYFKTPIVDAFRSYPHLLHAALKERFPYSVLNVIVAAKGGENSEEGAARFERDVLTYRPDVLCIDYALNDRRIGLEKARIAWTVMIQQAKAAGIKVILLTPTADSGAKLDDPTDPLNQHAAQIRKLATEHDVALVDSLALYQQEIRSGTPLEQLLSQPNHPNARGHALVVKGLERWFPVARQ